MISAWFLLDEMRAGAYGLLACAAVLLGLLGWLARDAAAGWLEDRRMP